MKITLSLKKNTLIENVGKEYYEYRKYLLSISSLGLTKISNLFHTKGIQKDIDPKNSHVLHLKKHLQKHSIDSYNAIIKGIIELRKLYIQMDQAVVDLYEWHDIQLNHGFYELEYLPENDRVRFSIDPAARKEILKRLLQLNLLQYGQESRVSVTVNNKKRHQLIKDDDTDRNTLFPEI
ncbi:hypothetical protein LRS05_09300 [Flavobacterium sp. J372]|uniref:hypothetical protein n=1 Tax=Flavobacterium sp. J372 TaxID=2898436 RepID=UPI002151B49B|nr:hypothetical protein [Flavobacterium sp. J372]MCR5862328.1 hypothetical protein [Flavobacterium sp. J372]